jgi:hypothetical protein
MSSLAGQALGKVLLIAELAAASGATARFSSHPA